MKIQKLFTIIFLIFLFSTYSFAQSSNPENLEGTVWSWKSSKEYGRNTMRCFWIFISEKEAIQRCVAVTNFNLDFKVKEDKLLFQGVNVLKKNRINVLPPTSVTSEISESVWSYTQNGKNAVMINGKTKIEVVLDETKLLFDYYHTITKQLTRQDEMFRFEIANFNK